MNQQILLYYYETSSRLFFCSFFGRIEDTKKTFRNWLTFMIWKLHNPTWNNKGVLENLTISLNHWLVPKKPKPKDTFWQTRKKRFQRRFSWTHMKKNWQLFVFMGFIFTVNVILFVARAVYFRWVSLFNNNNRERKKGEF